MTTRRLPRGPAPPRGLIGLLGLLAMSVGSSVETAERGIDRHALLQHAVEAAVRQSPLEARQAPAGVDAAPGKRPTRRQLSVDGGEPEQLRLRRLAAAAGAGADRSLVRLQVPAPRAGTTRWRRARPALHRVVRRPPRLRRPAAASLSPRPPARDRPRRSRPRPHRPPLPPAPRTWE